MTTTNPTTLPWQVNRIVMRDYKDISAQNVYVKGIHIGSYQGPIDLTNNVEIDAAFIVKAANNHTALVDYIRNMANTAAIQGIPNDILGGFIADAQAIIAAIEGDDNTKFTTREP